jgi:GNAT superfamily N-acetyltransferase
MNPIDLSYRSPMEDDHPMLLRAGRAWWSSPLGPAFVPRFWLRLFGPTCWLAESADGRMVGFLVGLVSVDRSVGFIHQVGVDPNLRRRGIGRALVERFVTAARERGAKQVETVAWAGDPSSIAFARALGFRPDDGPGTQPIYGTPSFPDYDWEGDDKTRLILALE